MSEQVIPINAAAIADVELSEIQQRILLPFKNTPSEEISPVIAKLHAGWTDEPERILAFFMRDNPALIPHANSLLGLDVLNWAEGMKEYAVKEDSYAKMLILSFAELPVRDDPAAAFLEAVKEKRFGMALWALEAHGEIVSECLGSQWGNAYLEFESRGDGLPYLAAQVLNGTMARGDEQVWQAGLRTIAAHKDRTAQIDYFHHQGMALSKVRFAVLDALVVPKWSGYPATEELDSAPGAANTGPSSEEEISTATAALEGTQVRLDVSALQGIAEDSRIAYLAGNMADEPERLALLPLTRKLHTAWWNEPQRIANFFLQDNPAASQHAEQLMALDYLRSFHEPMWEHGVGENSFIKLSILALSKVKPPRQPPAGFVEAIKRGKYEVAAAYAAYFGLDVALGICDRWTSLIIDLHDRGDERSSLVASQINAIVHRHAIKPWERDINRLAERLAGDRPVKQSLSRLTEQAKQFDPKNEAWKYFAGYALPQAVGQTDQAEGSDDRLVVARDAFLAASKKVKGLNRSQSNYGTTVYNLFEEVKKLAEDVNRTALAQAIFRKDNSVPIEVQMMILNQMEIGTA